MNEVYYAFTIVFLILVVLSLLTAIAFAWIVIVTELFELVNKHRVAKDAKESEGK